MRCNPHFNCLNVTKMGIADSDPHFVLKTRITGSDLYLVLRIMITGSDPHLVLKVRIVILDLRLVLKMQITSSNPHLVLKMLVMIFHLCSLENMNDGFWSAFSLWKIWMMASGLYFIILCIIFLSTLSLFKEHLTIYF